MRWIVLLLVAVAGAGWWMTSGGSTPAGGAAAKDLASIRAAMDAGRFVEASRLVDRVAPSGLERWEDRRTYALMAMEVRRPDAAARAVEKDARGAPRDTEEARQLLAEALIRSGRAEPAAKVIAELEQARLKGDRWHFLFALLSQLRGEPHIAREHLDPILQKGSRDAMVHVNGAQLAAGGELETERRLLTAIGLVDDVPRIQAALGRHLLSRGQPRRAMDHLEPAVKGRPWDRDARVDLSRACRLVGGPVAAPRAVELARAVVAEDPSDQEARIALAEGLAAHALADERRLAPLMGEAITCYGEVLRRPLADERLRMMVLLGIARAHVELIGARTAEADLKHHLAEALTALEAAEPLDTGKQYLDVWGVRLLAEVYFLRGKALRRAHVKDDRDCIEWYEKSFQTDRRHLDATWDLALLYYDFMRAFPYQRRASARFDDHIRERARRGLPPLDAERMRMVEHNRRIVAEHRDRGVDELTPGAGAFPPTPSPNEEEQPSLPGGPVDAPERGR